MDTERETTDKHIRVLIVDDEKGYVDVLSKRLSKRGFTVSISLSGSDAIKLVRENDFDVALLDLKMKDMDGIEVLKVFKLLHPAMEVIMVTGHGSRQAAQEGAALGVFDYLTKPCDIDSMISKITMAYNKKISNSDKTLNETDRTV